MSEKNIEVIHLWSDPSTASNALRIESSRQQYKQTKFVYLGGAISESADLDTEVKRRMGAVLVSVRRYSF